MNDRDPSNFKISLDDEVPDSVFGKRPVKPVKPKPTRPKRGGGGWWFVLLLLVLGLAAGYGYLDIQNKITKLQSTGSQVTENISGDLQSKFSSLSLKFAKLEDDLNKLSKDVTANVNALTKRIDTAVKKSANQQKAVDSLQGDINKARSAIDKIATGQKPVAEEIAALSKAMNEMEAITASLKKAMASSRKSLENDQKKLSEDMVSLRKRTDELSTAVTPLREANASLSRQLSQSEKSTKEAQSRFDRLLRQSVDRLGAQIKALEQGLRDIQGLNKQSTTPKASPPVSASPRTRQKEPVSPAPLPQPTTNVPESGRLIEQDIK